MFSRTLTPLLLAFVTLSSVHASELDKGKSALDVDRFLGNVKTLSSDAFGGRAPMSEGERLTLEFLEKEFRQAGFAPLFGDSYLQPVDLVSMEVNAETATMALSREGNSQLLAYGAEMVAWSQRVQEKVTVDNSELVFVGYGVVAPEYGWNDYQGFDMKGKTAVVLVNDPGFATGNPELFKGKAMTYYGRWTYKLEEAARQGAAAVILVHDTEPASYGWNTVRNSWTGPQFYLLNEGGGDSFVAVESWVQKSIAEALMAEAGENLGELMQRALTPEFEAVPLGTTLSATVESNIIKDRSYNVGAILPGSEAPDELFVYTAHWDHLGTGASTDPEEDVIFNGAVDNATGTAALIELAHAFKALDKAPRRSVALLAVTAEESGKLGSAWYADHPAVPLNQTVAGINIDAMSVYGPTNDVVVVGHGASQMEDLLKKAAAAQGRVIKPEPRPEAGSYYRSDHFNFAKNGVPMLYAKSGWDHRELGPEYLVNIGTAFVKERYHQPGDEVQDDWDLGGTMEDIQLYFEVGLEVANGEAWPEWYEGNEFRAIREASLAEGR